LFASTVLRSGNLLEAIIPSTDYETSFASAAERETFHRLLARAARVDTLDFDQPSEEAFMSAGRRIVAESDIILAIWDGEPSRGLGGTADVVRHAVASGKPVIVIWPAGVRR
jgi:hypothetical protein